MCRCCCTHIASTHVSLNSSRDVRVLQMAAAAAADPAVGGKRKPDAELTAETNKKQATDLFEGKFTLLIKRSQNSCITLLKTGGDYRTTVKQGIVACIEYLSPPRLKKKYTRRCSEISNPELRAFALALSGPDQPPQMPNASNADLLQCFATLSDLDGIDIHHSSAFELHKEPGDVAALGDQDYDDDDDFGGTQLVPSRLVESAPHVVAAAVAP